MSPHSPDNPTLTTERLLLRQLNVEDANEIFLLRSDETVNQYLDRPKATSLQDALDFINKIRFANENQQSFFWGISLKETNSLIGTICLWNFTQGRERAEIGYELLPAYHGKGFMQEALSKVLEFGFNVLKLSGIDAWTTKHNLGSLRLLERNHFTRNEELEKSIDRAVEGPDLVIFSLPSARFNSAVAPL